MANDTIDSNLIYFIVGILFSIPIGIGVNLFTPRIGKWLSNRPVVSAIKKINILQSELSTVAQLKSEMDKFYFKTLSSIFLVLLYISIGNVAWVFSSIGMPVVFVTFLVISLAFFLFAMMESLNYIRLLSKMKDFDQYKKDVERQIEKLKAATTKPKDDSFNV